MNKTLFAATAAIALMGAMPAMAGEWYAQVNAGATVATEADATLTATPDDPEEDSWSVSDSGDIDEGFAVGAAAGYVIGNGVRVEGEFLYTSNDQDGIDELDVDSVELNHAAFLVNVLNVIPMEGGVSPYVGAGVGYGSTTFDIDNEGVHDEDVVWQLRAGATYPVNETLTLDFGYRYLEMATWDGDFAVDDISGAEDEEDFVPGTIGVEFEPSAHILTVGARFKLGNTAP